MYEILLYYRDILGDPCWLAYYYSLVSYLDDIICCVYLFLCMS